MITYDNYIRTKIATFSWNKGYMLLGFVAKEIKERGEDPKER
jgi:hypothetical protein